MLFKLLVAASFATGTLVVVATATAMVAMVVAGEVAGGKRLSK